eukprot:1942543-Prymnesium_polylepis.1
MTAEGVARVRFEADDIIAAARLAPEGLEALMAEAHLLSIARSARTMRLTTTSTTSSTRRSTRGARARASPALAR